MKAIQSGSVKYISKFIANIEIEKRSFGLLSIQINFKFPILKFVSREGGAGGPFL